MIRIAVAFLLLSATTLHSHVTAQTNPPDQTPSTAVAPPQHPPEYQRPVSWKSLLPNIAQDQQRIWLFPARLNKKRNWIPTAAILGTTAALIALDSHDAPYFRRTSSFNGFNNVFTGNATTLGMVLAPVSLYAAGLARRDSKMQATALLAGEAVVDSEILATVLKDATKRVRPAALSPGQNFSDTWFESKGSILRGNDSWTVSAVSASASACSLSFRDKFNWPNPKYIDESKYQISLWDIDRLEVAPIQDAWNRDAAKRSKPEQVSSAAPPVYAVNIYLATGKSVRCDVHHTIADKEPTDETRFYSDVVLHFQEEQLARRIAKALIHAVELCGGGGKDPF